MNMKYDNDDRRAQAIDYCCIEGKILKKWIDAKKTRNIQK